MPIRVNRNYQSEGIAYPNQQGMRVYSSLWNADNWATQGGLVKIDWNSAPFIARFRHFRARACKWDGLFSTAQCASPSPANWWTSPMHKQLSNGKQGQMKWAKDNYMIYDYCKDTKRFNGQMPPECGKAQYWWRINFSSHQFFNLSPECFLYIVWCLKIDWIKTIFALSLLLWLLHE